ncbi:YciI family protein [Paraburkholderia strydomiana]|uniref:hypothetical protein n=1 Tax=Paraburkholderia strydomiana TaxID=1245417 RepID=UPI00286CD802|nr:hypothetical protein [Paraburkholderia strydomiana]
MALPLPIGRTKLSRDQEDTIGRLFPYGADSIDDMMRLNSSKPFTEAGVWRSADIWLFSDG